MKVVVLGAGPAGLQFARLMKQRRPNTDIRVVERNSEDSTFGFGVVFSDRALDFLAKDDPETYAIIQPLLVAWQDITVNHKGRSVRIDGIGFTALPRLQMLQALLQGVRAVGIEPEFNTNISSLSELGDADLIVGADGVNSLVRSSTPDDFGEKVELLDNRFVWFATTKKFETLSHTFIQNEDGYFNVHHYPYSNEMSTFVIETDAATFDRAGFASKAEAETVAYCEHVFAEVLQGHPLVSNKSIWRRFPKISNERWSVGNRVLVGDALRTAHFSIGSGTRLAMEDVIVLVNCLADTGDVPTALLNYEVLRRPAVDKLVKGANASADWYEHFPEHMRLEPLDFAASYIMRSGRVTRDKLHAVSPGFVSLYERERGRGLL